MNLTKQQRYALTGLGLAVLVVGISAVIVEKNRPRSTSVTLGAKAFGKIADFVNSDGVSGSRSAEKAFTASGDTSTSMNEPGEAPPISSYIVYDIKDGAIPQLPANADVIHVLPALEKSSVNLHNDLGIKFDSPKKIRQLTFEMDGYSVYLNDTNNEVNITRLDSIDLTRSSSIAPESGTNGEAKKYEFAPLLTVANAFMDKYAISKAMYGAPIQGGGDQRFGEASTFPSVFYPLSIDGVSVYAQYNAILNGLQINLNDKGTIVDSVQGVSPFNFERSSYPLVADKATLLKKAVSDIGYTILAPMAAVSAGEAAVVSDTKATKMNRTLIDGKFVYVQKDVYSKLTSDITGIYYVPAIIFTVENATEVYETKQVIIPLVD